MTNGKALLSLKVKTLAYCAVSMIVGCMILTYIIYKAQDGSKSLPMISETWATPPGTYISRWMIGNGFDMLSLLCIALYFVEKPSAGDSVFNPKFVLATALVGTFLLSWAAAICASDAPTCKGNATLNAFCFTAFFVLYDSSMLMTYVNRSKSVRQSKCFAIMILLTSTLLIIMFFSRFFMPNESDTTGYFALALIEWSNVAIIAFLTIHCILDAQDVGKYGVGFVDISAAAENEKQVSLLWFVSAWRISLVAAAICTVTLIISAIIGLIVGYLPYVKGEFWMISEMWVDIPGNWISRWGAVQGSHLGYLMQICLFYVTKNKSRRIALIISEISFFGLSIVAVCNMDEDYDVHIFGAMLFYVLYDIFIVITLSGHTYQLVLKKKEIHKNVQLGMCFLYAIVIAVTHPLRAISSHESSSIKAVLEWLNVFAIVGFAVSDVRVHANSANYVFGIFHYGLITSSTELTEPSKI